MVFLSLMAPIYYFVERRKAKKKLEDDQYILFVRVGEENGKKVMMDAYKYDHSTQTRLPLEESDRKWRLDPNSKRREIQDSYRSNITTSSNNLNSYCDEAHYEKERKMRLPRTIDEYYSYKTEFRLALENKVFSEIPQKFRDISYSFRDPYKCTNCTADDYQRMATWSNYQMDYMGRDASDNIIAKLTNTIVTDQFHPHTYLPRNGELTTLPGHHPLHYPSQG